MRLYRVLIEKDIRIEHIYRTSGMLGTWFSWKDENDNKYLGYMKKKEIQLLWILNSINEIVAEIKQRIKADLHRTDIEISETTFSSKKHLIAWLLIKTLNAEKQNVLLFFHDHGLASYNDCNDNKLNTNLDFSLANSICGYGVKSGFGGGNRIDYAGQNWWSNPVAFDTIIGNSITFGEFQNRETTSIFSGKIIEIDELIKDLLNGFYDTNLCAQP
jgi:hypothetical protein